MSRVFNRAIYVEQQSILCDIARHNFPILGLDHAEVINDDSTAVLDTLGRVSMIFLDPARRDDHGSRTYAIADCMPDVLTLKDMLLAKAPTVMVKLSPYARLGIRPSPISPARYMRCISSPPGMSARNCCWCWGAAVTPHRSWYVLMTSRCCRTRPAITATITPLSAILPSAARNTCNTEDSLSEESADRLRFLALEVPLRAQRLDNHEGRML